MIDSPRESLGGRIGEPGGMGRPVSSQSVTKEAEYTHQIAKDSPRSAGTELHMIPLAMEEIPVPPPIRTRAATTSGAE